MPQAAVTSMSAPPMDEKEAVALAAEPAPAAAGATGGGSAPTTPVAPTPTSPTTPVLARGEDAELVRAKRMVDIQANIRIEVQSVSAAAQRVRDLMKKSGGLITNETSSEESASAPQANFTLRVPVSRSDDVFRALDGLGVTRSRQIEATDIGKQYYDSVLRLRNLEITRDRLEQILKQATNVKDVLTIEAELTRLRGEMEQIKGQLRYLQDRAAFATIHLNLFTRQDQPVVEVIVKPEAKAFPGIRGGYLLDIHGDGKSEGFYGGGISVGLSRQADIYVEGFRRVDQPSGGLDAFSATVGGRFYSEYFGGGTREWFDPYLGLRGGYARFEGRNEFVTGISLGLEVFKTETLRLDLGAQSLVLLGKAGAHVILLPELGVDVAF
jgi:hypothetical protein